MLPTAQLHAAAAMRFFEAGGLFQQGKLRCEQAAELMGVSVSVFYRKRRRFCEGGEEGLVDHRISKISAKRVPGDETMHAITVFETKYVGRTPVFCKTE